MPYADLDTIKIPQKTKYQVRDTKDELELTYKEFLEIAAAELDEEAIESYEEDQ
ncbi:MULTISPECIES: hypothetical protein [Natrialbaceae]|uniref:hypothetical protein n=1 Tax=Natrialbaceae TaxID=1644061 RepID=UPI00207CEC24|nr:hypothetical protein [Natronococcus sp. CG52]